LNKKPALNSKFLKSASKGGIDKTKAKAVPTNKPKPKRGKGEVSAYV
jgi:hypothetical protein